MFEMHLNKLPDTSIALTIHALNSTGLHYEQIFHANEIVRMYFKKEIEHQITQQLTAILKKANLPILSDQLRFMIQQIVNIKLSVCKIIKDAGLNETRELDKYGGVITTNNYKLEKIRFNELDNLLPVVSFFK